MELLRESIKIQEENKMIKKLNLLQNSIGFLLDENLNEEFINQIQEESFVWTIISKKLELLTGQRAQKELILQEELYKILTFGQFVDECFQAILHFHLVIIDYKFNLHIVQDSIRQLKQQINILETHQQLKFNQMNRLSMCYTRHKSLKTDIFNHYKIKYKAAINGQEQKSIYARGDELTCFFPLLEESKTLSITVLGKKKEEGKDFQTLSRIDLDLSEVLISFPIQSYSKEQISPCLLTLDYQDDSSDAVFYGKNPIELQFSLSMPSEQRIIIMKGLREKQEEFERQIREEIEIRNQYIQSIIKSYKDLVYFPGDDLKSKNEVESQRFSCSACFIF